MILTPEIRELVARCCKEQFMPDRAQDALGSILASVALHGCYIVRCPAEGCGLIVTLVTRRPEAEVIENIQVDCWCRIHGDFRGILRFFP